MDNTTILLLSTIIGAVLGHAIYHMIRREERGNVNWPSDQIGSVRLGAFLGFCLALFVLHSNSLFDFNCTTMMLVSAGLGVLVSIWVYRIYFMKHIIYKFEQDMDHIGCGYLGMVAGAAIGVLGVHGVTL